MRYNLNKRISFSETIKIMFPSMKYAFEIGLSESVRYFIYDLAYLPFYDFSPKFFASEIVQTNPNYKDILKLSLYNKTEVYNILNNSIMKVHEEHMTPNMQLRKKLIELNNYNDFEEFIRNNYAIAIITKEENQKLEKGGNKSKNRSNLNEAFNVYKQLKININEFKFRNR